MVTALLNVVGHWDELDNAMRGIGDGIRCGGILVIETWCDDSLKKMKEDKEAGGFSEWDVELTKDEWMDVTGGMEEVVEGGGRIGEDGVEVRAIYGVEDVGEDRVQVKR